MNDLFYAYLAVMAITTYLIRMIPLAAVKKKITNRYLLSFLYYVPYAVLSVMTVPAIFYSTSNKISAAAGCVCAVILAYMGESLLKVAAFACAAVYITELVMKMV